MTFAWPPHLVVAMESDDLTTASEGQWVEAVRWGGRWMLVGAL